MRYDLNFWPAVDWRRESSIDPRFLTVVAVALVILAFLAVWSWSYADLQNSSSDLLGVSMANDKIKGIAEDVTRQNQCLANWRTVTAKLDHKAAQRLPWSNQLAAISQCIPDAIVLNQLTVRAIQVKVEVAEPAARTASVAAAAGGAAAAPRAASRKPKLSFRVQYELTLVGVAVGDGADDIISRFSRELPRHPAIQPWLDTVELTGVEPEARALNNRPGKKFTIVCKYRPIDWYDETAKPKS